MWISARCDIVLLVKKWRKILKKKNKIKWVLKKERINNRMNRI
jgi:hypothetical protein